MKDDNQHSDESRAASGNSEQGNPLFPFPDRLFSVFSALGEKSKYLAFQVICKRSTEPLYPASLVSL